MVSTYFINRSLSCKSIITALTFLTERIIASI